MGRFSVGCRIENHQKRDKPVRIAKIMVDTGSEFTWIPVKRLESIGVSRERKDVSFRMAKGQTITRSVRFAVIHVGKTFTIDEVVFAEPADLTLLGARTLEGLNLMVDAAHKRLVAAGPLPAAGARR